MTCRETKPVIPNSERFARYVIDLIRRNGTQLNHKYPCIFWRQIEAIVCVELRKAICYQWTQDEIVTQEISYQSPYHALLDYNFTGELRTEMEKEKEKKKESINFDKLFVLDHNLI